MFHFVRHLLIAGSVLSLIGCTDLVTRPEALTKAPAGGGIYRLQGQVEAAPAGGQSRLLPQGSAWQAFGIIPEGDVYRPRGMILTAEAMNVHEAYIVVQNGKWVGFWLPAENAFVASATPVGVQLIPEVH